MISVLVLSACLFVCYIYITNRQRTREDINQTTDKGIKLTNRPKTLKFVCFSLSARSNQTRTDNRQEKITKRGLEN